MGKKVGLFLLVFLMNYFKNFDTAIFDFIMTAYIDIFTKLKNLKIYVIFYLLIAKSKKI